MSSRATQVARNGIANRMSSLMGTSTVILALYATSSSVRLALIGLEGGRKSLGYAGKGSMDGRNPAPSPVWLKS